jgi:predicted glutamine amidotransferase
MCGIFGQISKKGINYSNIVKLAKHSARRGRDSSGLICYRDDNYKILKADYDIGKLLRKNEPKDSKMVLGHSRLVTNGLNDNQPVVRDDIAVIHNGIITNEKEVWKKLKVERKYEVDSELIVAIAEEYLKNNKDFKKLPNKILSLCEGVIACALLIPRLGKLLLFSNNGSLYTGLHEQKIYFASESHILNQIGCENIKQIYKKPFIVDVPISNNGLSIREDKVKTKNSTPLISNPELIKSEESFLQYDRPEMKRCSKCLLPETMPFIRFDEDGVCNYCHNHKIRNRPKPKDELFELVKPYRREERRDCIVPFSGGRDSSYGLHLIVNELKMKPIAYTYDWGMVTDLARRNISRMCSKLGVENIIVAADIAKKRENIRKNLVAWLKSPHLGMISILTAGDKHFFKYVEHIKRETGIDLNLWAINPLEVTYFKSGFLGVKPDFEEERVYSNGILKQVNYHIKRFTAMLESPGYFNGSLFDTLSGEFYRSFKKKKDYYHIYDYWRWDEETVNGTLKKYDWEMAPDTNTTWRIGDGTAGFYNYIYYTVAGFTEHDTFRSNQIREGALTREEAMKLIMEENRPRYQSIKWYLNILGLDFEKTIKTINQIPKLYKKNK